MYVPKEIRKSDEYKELMNERKEIRKWLHVSFLEMLYDTLFGKEDISCNVKIWKFAREDQRKQKFEKKYMIKL